MRRAACAAGEACRGLSGACVRWGVQQMGRGGDRRCSKWGELQMGDAADGAAAEGTSSLRGKQQTGRPSFAEPAFRRSPRPP